LNTLEITVYTQTDDNFITLYCEDCKPQGASHKGTLVVSNYDHFCSGCGQDFLEMAQEQKPDIICRCGHSFPWWEGAAVVYLESVPCYECMKKEKLQQAWHALQAVPSYVEAQAAQFAGER